MAQRIIHYVFGELLAKEAGIKDKNRFLLGSVLPDAYAKGRERDITHFKCKTDKYVYFDFEAFRKKYETLVATDELYSGYYMHLVEDAMYRKFILDRQLKTPGCIEEVELLHHDYHLLNAHIVKKYAIQNTIVIPEQFEEEPICNLAGFQVREFVDDMNNDFIETPTGSTTFITEQNVDEFIDGYLDAAVKELQALQEERQYLRVEDCRWERLH